MSLQCYQLGVFRTQVYTCKMAFYGENYNIYNDNPLELGLSPYFLVKLRYYSIESLWWYLWVMSLPYHNDIRIILWEIPRMSWLSSVNGLAAPEGAKDEHRRIAGLRCLMPLRLPSGRIGSQQEIYCGTPEFEKTIYYVTYYVTYYSVMISVPGSWLFLGTSLARSPGSQTRLAGSGLAMGNLQKNPTMNCTIQVGYYDYLMIITIAYRNYILN